jgi:pimeloyl-ACP methyl ester carboxylesterase
MSQNSDFLSVDRRVVLGAMAGAAVAGLTLGTAQAAGSSAPEKPWTSEGYVERMGGRIHWVSLGEGEPLVLMHKLGGWVADWRDMAPLIKGRRVIALDMPGHGQSTMLSKPPYAQSLPESAAMIKAVLEEIGVSRCAVAGVSLGGCIGTVMTACWPETVSKLALMSVSLSSRVSRDEMAQQDAAAAKQFDAQGLPLPRTAAQVASFGKISPNVLDAQNASRSIAGLWVRASERGVGMAGVADYLPRIACPALLVYGDSGAYLKFEDVGRAKLRDVRVKKIPDTGSFVQQEKPAETAAILNEFLNG